MNIERSAEQHEGESTISIVCVWKHELKTAGRKNPYNVWIGNRPTDKEGLLDWKG